MPNNDNLPIKDGQIDIPTFLDAKRRAALIADDREEVRRLFGIDEEKKKFADALIETARLQKDNSITPEIAMQATEQIYSRMFELQEPPAGLQTRLRYIYLNRVKAVYKPTIIAFALSAIIGGSALIADVISKAAHESKLLKQERGVEKTIDDLFSLRSSLETQINVISTYVSEKNPAESADLKEILRLVNDLLKQTESFFGAYRPSVGKVTRGNYASVSLEGLIIKDKLDAAGKEIGRGNSIITLNENLISVRQGLESLIGEVRAAKPVDVFLSKANTAYQSGISAVEHRQLSDAQKYQQQLAQVKTDAQQFSVMPADLEKAYQSLMAIVLHQPTKEWAEDLYSDAQTYIRNADVSNLKQTITDLASKTQVLAQEYEIYIVMQSPARAVWNIYWDQIDKKTGKTKITREDYFIRCQAKKDGQTVKITFFDVGSDKMVTATTFGLRISGDELGGITDDQMSEEFRVYVGSGKYQKTPLVVKVKGYPEEEIKYISSITHKPLPFSDKTAMVPNN